MDSVATRVYSVEKGPNHKSLGSLKFQGIGRGSQINQRKGLVTDTMEKRRGTSQEERRLKKKGKNCPQSNHTYLLDLFFFLHFLTFLFENFHLITLFFLLLKLHVYISKSFKNQSSYFQFLLAFQ